MISNEQVYKQIYLFDNWIKTIKMNFNSMIPGLLNEAKIKLRRFIDTTQQILLFHLMEEIWGIEDWYTSVKKKDTLE